MDLNVPDVDSGYLRISGNISLDRDGRMNDELLSALLFQRSPVHGIAIGKCLRQ